MLKLFRVLNNENDQTIDSIDYPILINLEQIVTIKPIRIMFQGHIIDGYWVRTANGKKYKATRIPSDLEMLLNDDSHLTDAHLDENLEVEGNTLAH
ncbi:MAG: hypothetical protein EP326_02360 [Deltaproteobacteria bacterium]|jgi:hypothetical protein|nr:MAG: hypothetical protein EP326_02360 [Deltaproteobacteria bacterium]TNF24917.1 MAG: hypothetical protein EP319_17410 [Deltaproteobacteria bacterium]